MGMYTGYTAIMEMMQYDKGIERYLREVELPAYDAPTILDIGCGSGVASLALAKRFPHARILTTDINQKFAQDALEKLKSRGHRDAEAALLNVSTPQICAVLRQTGKHVGRILEQDSFDIVMMGGVLCYSADVKTSIEKIGILLKENGTLVNLEMKSDGNIPEFISRVYQYDRWDEEDIADLAQIYIGETTIAPLSSHYFPVNLTRTSIISTKK